MRSVLSPRAVALMLFVAIGVGVWFLAREHLSVEQLAEHERQLRGVIESRPWTAFLLGFVVYTLVSLFPGTSGKSILCGWFFGFWQSLAMVTASLTLAALAGFSISRYVLRDFLHSRFGKHLGKLERALDREGAFYLLTLRMLHVPFTLVNYASGASHLRARTFAWTTFVGLIPSTMIFVGVGANLPTLQQLVEEGAKRLLSPPLLLALVLMGLAPWVIRGLLRKLGVTEEGTSSGKTETAVDDDPASVLGTGVSSWRQPEQSA